MQIGMHTKVIAELCYNHQGSIELAKKMIDKASELGLWAIKLQKWDVEGLPVSIKNKKRNDKHAFGETYYEHRKALEFSISQLKELKDYAENKGLEFMCSGKDYNSFIDLVNMNIKHIKVPSQRYLDNDVCKFLVRKRSIKGFKVYVSTGMYKELEILNSKWVNEADVIMHCISLYPASLDKCDFGFLKSMPFYNGYSSHEKDGKAIKYAVAMGCEYIERHFTLDKNMKGTDQSLASDPEEMQRIIKEIKEAELIYGNGYRNLSPKEIDVRSFYRSF